MVFVPPDTSSTATITFNPVAFPQADIAPSDTTICYGAMALLKANIKIGTSYTWSPAALGAGNISGTPTVYSAQVSPDSTENYILRIVNSGCPNPLLDTFMVKVLEPVVVNAGRDTSVVAGQLMQFNAYSSSSDSAQMIFYGPPPLNSVIF